jgi:transketolase
VKIGATHAGITVGEDGATHQCNEDLALMRVIPGMCVINPSDAAEARAAVRAAIEHNGPVYLRFGRLAVPVIHDEDTYEFILGKGETLAESENDTVTLIATGMMVEATLKAKEMLAAENISARVINIHTIKPLDIELITKAAQDTGAIVTAEEHSVIGGLGSAVAEAISETCPVPLCRVGVQDTFGASGPAKDLLPIYGLDAETIVKKAKEVIALK